MGAGREKTDWETEVELTSAVGRLDLGWRMAAAAGDCAGLDELA